MKKYLFYISQNYSFAILRPIQKLLKHRGDDVRWFFEGNQVDTDYLHADEQRLLNVGEIHQFNPDVVVATANSIPTFMPGLKVCVFHGFDAGKKKPSGEKSHFRIRGCFDLYCTQGPNTTRPFRQQQETLGYFNVIETGWSALDPLFDSENSPEPNEKPTILFCSTFSKKLSCAAQLSDEIDRISRNGKWNWIVQFHPKMPRDVAETYRQMQHEHLTFVETDDIIPLLKSADMMLCDTSSVISMFIVQKKPVVTFRNIEPGPHLIDIRDADQLESALEQAEQPSSELLEQIEQHIQQLHPYRDGHSSKRVIDAIDEIEAGKYPVRRKKPWNLIRNLKFRKRLNYWKP